MTGYQKQAGGILKSDKKLLEANINLGKGKNAVLIIYEGKTVEKQIEEFAIKYSILHDLGMIFLEIKSEAVKKMMKSIKAKIND